MLTYSVIGVDQATGREGRLAVRAQSPQRAGEFARSRGLEPTLIEPATAPSSIAPAPPESSGILRNPTESPPPPAINLRDLEQVIARGVAAGITRCALLAFALIMLLAGIAQVIRSRGLPQQEAKFTVTTGAAMIAVGAIGLLVFASGHLVQRRR